MLNHPLISEKSNLPPQSGRVVNCLPDGSFMVESQGRGWHCRQAASCLLQPEYQDLVLLATDDAQKTWLLAILERDQAQALAHIKMAGDLCISTPQGSLHLNSQENIQLDTNVLAINAAVGHCKFEKIDLHAEEISSWVGIARWVGRCSESLWDQVTQISHNLFRHTTQTEHVRAAQIDYQAENNLRMHANHTILTSQSITKIDSAQIHVG